MSVPFIGQIELFAGNFAPRDWMFCDGSLLPIAQHSALFAILGVTYGGDGRTTFGLPDLRGRTAMGAGQGPGLSNRVLGQKTGTETVTLGVSTMASHDHGVSHPDPGTGFDASTAVGSKHQPASGDTVAQPMIMDTAGLPFYSDQAPDTDVEGAAVGGTLTLASTGGGGSHANMAPFLGLHYILAVQGIFPSRN